MSGLVFDPDFLPPGRMTYPTILASGIESGRSLSGITTSIDPTGGGLVAVSYTGIVLGNTNPSKLRRFGLLQALNGGVRSILVPLMTEFTQPGSLGTPLTVTSRIRTPHSDGATFSDTSEYTQPGSQGVLGANAALNAGTIEIVLDSTLIFEGGEWFGAVHATKLNRVYMITDIDGSNANGDGTTTWTVGIRPTLREALAAGAPLSFSRPKCLMRLAPGSTVSVDLERFWWGTPDLHFIESFGAYP